MLKRLFMNNRPGNEKPARLYDCVKSSFHWLLTICGCFYLYSADLAGSHWTINKDVAASTNYLSPVSCVLISCDHHFDSIVLFARRWPAYYTPINSINRKYDDTISVVMWREAYNNREPLWRNWHQTKKLEQNKKDQDKVCHLLWHFTTITDGFLPFFSNIIAFVTLPRQQWPRLPYKTR